MESSEDRNRKSWNDRSIRKKRPRRKQVKSEKSEKGESKRGGRW